MAARKTTTRKKPELRRVDLSQVTLAQLASLIATLGVLGTAAAWGFAWYFSAEHAHMLTHAHEPRIQLLEENDAEYETIWAEAREQRKEEIRQAEEIYRQYKAGALAPVGEQQ